MLWLYAHLVGMGFGPPVAATTLALERVVQIGRGGSYAVQVSRAALGGAGILRAGSFIVGVT